jgi:hypothetical protein
MPITLQAVDIGSAPGDGTGDLSYVAFGKVNSNMAVLVGAMEDAERKAFVASCTDDQQTIEERMTVLGTTNGILRTFRMPFAFVLLEVRASLVGADSAGDIELDILENGVSVFQSGDVLTIAQGQKTSVGYSPAPVLYNVILNDDAEIKVEVVTMPTGTDGVGLNVMLIGYVIWATF